MTDIELLPLPEYLYGREASDNERVVTVADAHAYAIRNVAHATEPLKAEIERLRAANIAYSEQVAKLIGGAGNAEARAERLAEAFRELKDLMLGQVKWEPCDCGCPQQRTPDGPHSVTWLRAVQQVEIAISKAEGKE